MAILTEEMFAGNSIEINDGTLYPLHSWADRVLQDDFLLSSVMQ
jgi:hypothetical protein